MFKVTTHLESESPFLFRRAMVQNALCTSNTLVNFESLGVRGRVDDWTDTPDDLGSAGQILLTYRSDMKVKLTFTGGESITKVETDNNVSDSLIETRVGYKSGGKLGILIDSDRGYSRMNVTHNR